MRHKVFFAIVMGGLAAQVVSVFAWAQSAPPEAQSVAPKNDASLQAELQDFKKKVAEAKAAAAARAQKNLEDAAVTKSADGAPTPPPLVNPLGPAAVLPVKGSISPPAATAKALSVSPEEVQAKLDAETAEQEKKIEQETFDNAVKALLPLKPEQIRALYGKFEQSRKAAETPIKIPDAKTNVQAISLDPGHAPPVIRLAPGYVTTISVLDSSGAPWPIQDLSFAGDFDVTPPESGGNIVRITPSTAHGVGNMSVRLVDLVTPVIFTLNTSLEVVDYRFEARMPKNGPLAKTPIIEFGGLNTVAGTDTNLSAVLDGTIPAGAEKLRLQGTDARSTAWRVGDKVYLRTPLSLLSPAWDSSAASSDGTTVYTLNETPVIILSDEGRMVRAHIVTDEALP